MINYSSIEYQYTRDFLKKVHELKSWTTYRFIFMIWLSVILMVEFFHLFLIKHGVFWFLYPIILFLLASRQGALLNIVHEGSHYLISRNRTLNDWISRWICALPLGIDFDGFRHGHKMHHANTGTDKDPPSDTEKYKHVLWKHPRMAALFLKDLLGLTALQIFFAYETKQFDREEMKKDGRKGFLTKFIFLVFVQFFVLGILFQFNIVHYVLLWILPAMTAHMLLMRIRGIAEHGLPMQLGVAVATGREGSNLTRSFLTSAKSYRYTLSSHLEKFFIGSANINYHHEHHALPGVPYYFLPDVHREVSVQLKSKNSELFAHIYQRGYFAAFFAKHGS